MEDIKSGDSKSDPGAGQTWKGGKTPNKVYTRKMTTADKAGAWILTVVALTVAMVGAFALLVEDTDMKDYTAAVLTPSSSRRHLASF